MIIVVCLVNTFRIHLTAILLKTISFKIIITEHRKLTFTHLKARDNRKRTYWNGYAMCTFPNLLKD
jgi:hypothetical protein